MLGTREFKASAHSDHSNPLGSTSIRHRSDILLGIDVYPSLIRGSFLFEIRKLPDNRNNGMYQSKNVRSKISWHWKFFKFCKSVEWISGIVEGWFIVGVTNTRSEDGTPSTRPAPYQSPKPNRLQGGNPGLLHSHTHCAAIVGVSYMSRIWTAIWSQGCSMGYVSRVLDCQSMASTCGSAGND